MSRKAKPTHVERVRRMLVVAGPAGLTQLDMMRPPDGGPPIMALSQRIGDLKKTGVRVLTETVRSPSGAPIARYHLDAVVSRGSVPTHNPSSAPWQASQTQPEEEPLVHSSSFRPGFRA